MYTFEKPIRIGTLVKIHGRDEWQIIEAFFNDRKLVKLEGIGGSFQRGHIIKYSNKFNKQLGA
jgi:hypothetical protein